MLGTFVKSIYAGVAIGIAGMLYLSVEDKIVGSGLFSIGLISVLLFGFELFTGRVCYVRKKPLEWPLIWTGNGIGAGLAALLARKDTVAIVATKLSKPIPDLFLDGVVCGILIGVSVMGYKKSRSLVAPVLGVMAFVLAGSEHCVADAFYFFSCGMFPVKELIAISIGNMVGGGLIGMGIEHFECTESQCRHTQLMLSGKGSEVRKVENEDGED